ncbi:MAG: potassium transporter [Candidatus Epulonipiscioides saccharophilum]|nr:MAG: potassium transporter [Epulopiscium sp. AS2M-Bin001]
MLTSLAYIFIFGLIGSLLSKFVKIPSLVGMLIAGILIGPFALNLLDQSILDMSADLRTFALIIILIKAGLSLKLSDMKQVGRPALFMSFVPASCEIIGYVFFAKAILGLSWLEGALLGAVLAAVSPAVVVPRMTKLIDEGYSDRTKIPQLITAGASCDDIFVIVLFSSFLSALETGDNIDFTTLINVPISIFLGISIGVIVGLLLCFLFKHFDIQNSVKIILIISCSFLLLQLQDTCEGIVAISGLIGVMSLSIVLKNQLQESTTTNLSQIISRLWVAFELLLFVLVGASVNIDYTLHAGFSSVIIIFIGLIFRCCGVFLALLGTNLNKKEKLYCAASYLPKATVQAAIGGVALATGLGCGEIVLCISVIAILITAPLGAILIDKLKAWIA